MIWIYGSLTWALIWLLLIFLTSYSHPAPSTIPKRDKWMLAFWPVPIGLVWVILKFLLKPWIG